MLGPLRVTRGGVDLTPAPPKIAKLLALLIVHSGETIPGDRLVTELWEQDPPRCATASLRVYVSQLRKLLNHPGGCSPILTAPPGYILDISTATLDAAEFEKLYEIGRVHYAAGDFALASDLLQRALEIWRGPVLDGISGSCGTDSFAAIEEEKRLNCTELSIASALELARHHEVIEDLMGLVVRHPLREPFYRQLMIALYRAGRQGDALDVYRSARRVIHEELGVEPGPGLRRAQEAILRADAAFLDTAGVAPLAH
ncbi:AfsR/SARP family transcriptional regulator [Streptomyces sp. HNM0663]|uniref:AfsR/SARP family transcriptional regulator n=1 Tax=Streptomyces chengmaiensis TaxID=3040919 RepID=A0ABT6HH26_9ACTN|nr:AfsR/SARP family transcriptional regulator [Streptomyces chengmaiensis]MDH2388063.1 AfsR/SARP family transcriptional regulator [Streptomyces chengmaiensis]